MIIRSPCFAHLVRLRVLAVQGLRAWWSRLPQVMAPEEVLPSDRPVTSIDADHRLVWQAGRMPDVTISLDVVVSLVPVEGAVAEGVATAVAGVLLLVGMAGIILPVLPGSLMIILTLLAWALLIGGPAVWTAAIIGMLLAGTGWAAATVLTGRMLHRERIPRGPVLVAVTSGLVGMVLLPPLGLFIGFAAGLFIAEYLRRDRDVRAAAQASLQAVKAMGLGILVEFGLAGLAVSSFLLGALVHLLG